MESFATEPVFTQPWTDIVDPTRTKDRTESVDPRAIMSNTEQMLPSLTTERTETVDPMSVKLRTEMFEPHFAVVLSEMELPKFTSCNTDSFLHEPNMVRPAIETVLPTLQYWRRERVEPRFVKFRTEVVHPNWAE
jgi:hypothetical protein